MKKTLLILLATLLFTVSAVAENLEFEIVKEGDYFQRDASDRTYSAVICSAQGLEEFIEEYPLEIKLPEGFFSKKLLIVGFSDRMQAVTVDGFKRKAVKACFYLDLYDKDIKVQASPLSEGKKYTSYCAIGVDSKLTIAHVQIREGISGSSKQYGETLTNEIVIDGSSPQAFRTSLERLASSLSEEKQTQLAEAIMKLSMNIDVGPVKSQEETRQKAQGKLCDMLNGKTFEDIVAISQGLSIDERTKTALNDFKKMGTSSVYQHDADIVRLRHLKYLCELIREYYIKVGHYPLQSDTQIENYVHIASPSQRKYTEGGPPYNYIKTDLEKFKMVLEKGLGRKVDLPFDPQLVPANKPSFYLYMVKGDRYFLAVHLHNGEGFARKIGPYYYKVEVSNVAIPEQQIFTYDGLMANSEFSRRVKEEYIIKPAKNPEQADIEI